MKTMKVKTVFHQAAKCFCWWGRIWPLGLVFASDYSRTQESQSWFKMYLVVHQVNLGKNRWLFSFLCSGQERQLYLKTDNGIGQAIVMHFEMHKLIFSRNQGGAGLS